MIKEFIFADRNSLFTTLSDNCQTYLSAALAKQQNTSFMVSGGSTPAPLYEALSLSTLDWKNIKVALVDERWVDKNHSASNEALIYRSLLINHAKQASFISMKTSAESAETGCSETESRYQDLPKPFALSILGMGNDGHTASLFPNAQGLSSALSAENQQLTAAIIANQSAVTGPNTERISLTLHGLLQSERLILLLTGEEKLDVFRTAMTDLTEQAVIKMPVRSVLRQNEVPVEIYWAP